MSWIDANGQLAPSVDFAHAVLTAWLGGLPLSLEWNKAHLINHLAGVHGYRHYLELCTFMSGGRYDEIDRAKLPTCRRLMYRCPDDFDDGLTSAELATDEFFVRERS